MIIGYIIKRKSDGAFLSDLDIGWSPRSSDARISRQKPHRHTATEDIYAVDVCEPEFILDN